MPDITPRADRPHMPGYDLFPEIGGPGLLPWSWAEERLTGSHNYWIGTVSPDGQPHATPVWAVWLESALYFSVGPRSLKARNLARDPRCTATTEYAGEAVIIEGTTAVVIDIDTLARFKAAYDVKYDWDIDVTKGPIYAITPATVFGFIEAAREFAGTATRWRFS
jgi:hypothetical protein